MFREEYIIPQIVNRAFISTLTEIQIRLLFTRSECRYLNVTGHCQQFNNTVGSSYGSLAKLFANVSNIAGNVLLTFTLSTTGDQILLSPKNASKVIFNAREVLRYIDIAKLDIPVLLMFMFHLSL